MSEETTLVFNTELLSAGELREIFDSRPGLCVVEERTNFAARLFRMRRFRVTGPAFAMEHLKRIVAEREDVRYEDMQR
jgi:hypothetical protein